MQTLSAQLALKKVGNPKLATQCVANSSDTGRGVQFVPSLHPEAYKTNVTSVRDKTSRTDFIFARYFRLASKIFFICQPYEFFVQFDVIYYEVLLI